MSLPARNAPRPNSTSSVPTAGEALGLEAFRSIDRMREALSAQLSGGLSPQALALAFFDWSIHLASAPGKRLDLAYKALRKTQRLANYLTPSNFLKSQLLLFHF